MRALVLDTETHDSTNPALVEYGHAEAKFIDGDFVMSPEIYVNRYNPMRKISFGAMATHGITDEDVADEPPCTEFVRTEADYIIAHQVDFDGAVIGDTTAKRICTLALARSIWPETSHKLLALMYMLFPEKARSYHKNAHGVETDIMMCGRLVEVICAYQNITDMESLYQASEKARIPTHITFGKHKGTAIKDLPSDYCRWYMGLPDADPYIVKAMSQ